MYDRLRQIHATASRYDKRYAVIFVDLDNFKPINDQLGHDAGDALLCQVADRLKSNLRVMDTPARYGGDEFIVLVPEINDMHEVRIIAEKLSSALRQPYLIKHQTVSVTPSIGIALYPEHAQDPDDLIRVADAAMYNVKSSGRDGLAFYAASASTQLPN
jgi:diguanylate cyclase (GGDEF)-like protein